MKVITAPKIHVAGAMQFFPHPDYPIPMDDGDTDLERLGAAAAKGCYDSFGANGRAVKANQRQIMESRHGSVLGHLNVSLFIEGISRGLTLELNRHASHMAISQRSTRYVDEKDSAIVLNPYYSRLWRNNGFRLCLVDDLYTLPEAKVWHLRDGYALAYHLDSDRSKAELIIDNVINPFFDQIDVYTNTVEKLLESADPSLSKTDKRKWARGIARDVLPNNLETRGIWTTNLRQWRWIIESRTERHAELEIRRLGVAIYESLKDLSPVHFEDFSYGGVVDGIPEIVPLYSKI